MNPASHLAAADPGGFTWAHATWEVVAAVVLAGCLHGVAETAHLVLHGVRIAWFDPPAMALLTAGVFLPGLCAALAFFGLAGAGPAGGLSPVVLQRRIFALGLAGAYLAGVVLLAGRGGHAVDGLIAAGTLLLGWAALWMLIHGHLQRYGSFAILLAGIVGGGVLAAGWALSSGAARFILPGLALALLAGCAALTRLVRPRPSGPGRSLACSLAGLLLLSAGLALGDGGRLPRILQAVSSPRPNVILIVLDTLSASHLELFGHPSVTMPRLTAFARDCDVVLPITAVSPVTPPTHASIFTGLWPHQHGCLRTDDTPIGTPMRWCLPMRTDVPTLAGWLGQNGYRSVGLAANYSLSDTGMERGFDAFDLRPARPWLDDLASHGAVCWSGFVFRKITPLRKWLAASPWGRQSGVFEPFPTPYRRGDEITRRALGWLADRTARDARPYLLFLNYMDAHTPYFPRRAFAELEKLAEEDLPRPEEQIERIWQAGGRPPPQICARLAHFYDEGLRDLDDYLGDLLDELRRSGELDRAIVIITSDHGEEFGEHGQLDHQSNVYEPQVRVPLLIRVPAALKPLAGLPPHFQHVDILPTLAQWLRIDPPPGLRGRPRADGRDYALSELSTHPRLDERLRTGMLALVRGGFKYIRRDDGVEQLFQMTSDPGELVNRLDTADTALLASFRALAAQRDAEAWQGRSAGPGDEAALRKLRSLGYVK